MAKQLLPNGSVVTLKGATKKLMTIGIEVEMEGDEKTYDYIAIPYPEGYIDSETMFLFMQEDIELNLSSTSTTSTTAISSGRREFAASANLSIGMRQSVRKFAQYRSA